MDTYAESFLDICDAEGNAPEWAINQIFEEHGSDIDEFTDDTPEELWSDGQTILHFIGY